jgi:two-component sensor histidine kinase
MGVDGKSAADRVNILLVDDQPAKLTSYELILQDLGENLLKASSAQEALEILLKNDVAVILADVCMPDLDGFELAQMIREHPRYQDTAIIFVSAIHLSDLDSLKGYELGGVDYVPVPVVPGVLRGKVRVFVDLYRKSRELARMNVELEARVAERTSELEAAIARQELLAREVDHRARNALAVIQSIVSLTPSNSADEFVDAIKGRIRAMASAHNLLSETRWRGADLVRLVNEELAPYRAAKDRIRIRGPQVDILPTVAQNLALAIHELATNAAKYGALAADGGRLNVMWEFSGDELVLEWDELVNRPVVPPKKEGFGSRVIKSSIEGQLKGAIESAWRDDGLRFKMRIPAAHFTQNNDGPHTIEVKASDPAALDRIRSRKIMIVEDEPLVAMMMAEFIQDLRGTVIGPFSSVREAAAGLDAQLDAALLDVNVGTELAYPIAEELNRQGIPVIFVTGYQANSIDPRFATAPVLTKPIEQSELAGALARVLPREALAQA